MSGCDHHGGAGSFTPCRCDFCLGGRPLTARIWGEKVRSQAAQGLQSTLSRGPDPRSVCESGLKNWELRSKYYQLLGEET